MSSVFPNQPGSENLMRRYSSLRLAVLAGGLTLIGRFFSVVPALADEIVLVADEHGGKTYINSGEPAEPHAVWTTSGFRPNPTAIHRLPSPELHHLVEQTASQYEVDPQLVHAIIQVESDYNPKAVSRRGAMGLMQLIPSTAMRFGVENPFDPKQNLQGGVNYLKYLLQLFGGDLALSLAAYNAGEHSVLRYGGVPSFKETKHYVRKVTDLYQFGAASNMMKPNPMEPYKAPIYRYADAQGVVHFTNVE